MIQSFSSGSNSPHSNLIKSVTVRSFSSRISFTVTSSSSAYSWNRSRVSSCVFVEGLSAGFPILKGEEAIICWQRPLVTVSMDSSESVPDVCCTLSRVPNLPRWQSLITTFLSTRKKYMKTSLMLVKLVDVLEVYNFQLIPHKLCLFDTVSNYIMVLR